MSTSARRAVGAPKRRTARSIGVGLIGFRVAGKAFHAPAISAVDGLRLAAIGERSRPGAAGDVKYGLDPQEEALRRGETPLRNSLGMERPEAWGTLSTAENRQIESRPPALLEQRPQL